MYLGIDVGGTHTDGAGLDENFEIIRTVKIPTRSADIPGSLAEALGRLLAGGDPARVRRLAVSSTLGLNAILTGQADRVGVLAGGGPGLPVEYFGAGPLYEPLSGLQNHLGEILVPQNPAEAREAAARLLEQGAEAFAVISKFGPKNPEAEIIMAEAVRAVAPDKPLTAAGRLVGRLNFPRRLNTAVFNSAVSRLYENFIRDLAAAARDFGLTCPLRLLTADGGALSPEEALAKPALTLASGPAAGLLGLWSLAGLTGDALMVDIGGTSTDLAIVADGRPLTTAEGLEIAGQPTLIRAFLTRSLALGGDLGLELQAGRVGFAARREGPALALSPEEEAGRRPPTFTDALNVLGLTQVGRTDISRRALAGLDPGSTPEATANLALNRALELIGRAARDFLGQANSRPIYTLGAIRLARPVQPTRAAFLGGPAEALARPVAEALGLKAVIPPYAALANAIGAARSRPSPTAELYADTALGTWSIPALGLSKAIGHDYTLARAETDILAALKDALAGLPEAGPPQVTEAESFNQLTGRGRADKVIRVRAQARPGFLGLKEADS
ncbi:MAG: hydantoinase/oxoprolinase family protein [Candidatus Adiutrix sp.]|jgi:N-methylhydantoinase A/oxoprolinase/acetone carboxylase beta subunit|nr:hydantoinase/oxoprolinase family protein [Candidatus Adiutrix sp.]